MTKFNLEIENGKARFDCEGNLHDLAADIYALMEKHEDICKILTLAVLSKLKHDGVI